MFVDSHCHLNYAGLVEDQAAVIARARESGVSAMLNISTRQREWDDVIAAAERERDIWATVGIHPHEADAHPDVDTERLVDAAAHPARPGSIITTSIAIAPGSRRAFAPISPPRG